MLTVLLTSLYFLFKKIYIYFLEWTSISDGALFMLPIKDSQYTSSTNDGTIEPQHILCVFAISMADLISKNQSEHHAGAFLDESVNKWKWGDAVVSHRVTWWYTVKVWPFPELILIRGFRQTKLFNSPVPHPPLTHSLCRLSNGSMLTFPWETSVLSAAICLISYCNSQCKG